MDINKKMRTVKLLFCITIVLICTFCAYISKVEIDDVIEIRGVLIVSEGESTLKFNYSVEQGGKELELNKVYEIKINGVGRFTGKLVEIENEDLKLNNQEIYSCLIRFDSVIGQANSKNEDIKATVVVQSSETLLKYVF